MATRGITVTNEWTEVTNSGALDMSDGATYVVEIQSDGTRTVILAHDEESNMQPAADADGHAWYPRSINLPRETSGVDRSFTKRSGWFWWLRTTRGTARVVISETE